MKSSILIAALIVLVVAVFFAVRLNKALGQNVVGEPGKQPRGEGAAAAKSPLDFVVKDIDGKDYDLAQLRGKVVMIVNVASKCGLTPQYEGLEKLYDTYQAQGLVVIGFPANNFNGQEPGTDAQIKEFCSTKYDVSFPMMSKISVKGDDQHALYKFLTEEATAGQFKGEIGWNFTKFIVDRDGQLFARFASKTKPGDAEVSAAIEKALAAK
ncbi:MAG: glutathione peroxidase [Tepidisphaeraceae bacterium]